MSIPCWARNLYRLGISNRHPCLVGPAACVLSPADGARQRLGAGEVALNMFKNQTAVEFVTGFPNFKTPPGVKGVDDLDPRITEFDVVLESGQTVALSSFKSEPKGDQIIAFITATLIDPAGRRIR